MSIFGTLAGVSPHRWLLCLRPSSAARRPCCLAAVGRGRGASAFLASPPRTVNGGPCRYCGRDFSEDEIDPLPDRQGRPPPPGAVAGGLSAPRLAQRRPKGARASPCCVCTATAVLPPPRRAPVVRRPLVPGPATDRALFPTPERLADVQPVAAEPVRNAGEGRLWNEFIARYLGYSTLPGAALLCAHSRRRTPRRPRLRRRSLEDRAAGQARRIPRPAAAPLVVNNARALPWIRIKNLASPRSDRTTAAGRLGAPLRLASGPARDLLREHALRRKLLPGRQQGRQNTGPRQDPERTRSPGQGR